MLPRLPLLGELYVVQEGFGFGKGKWLVCEEMSEGSQFVPCTCDSCIYAVIAIQVFSSTFLHCFSSLVLNCAPIDSMDITVLHWPNQDGEEETFSYLS